MGFGFLIAIVDGHCFLIRREVFEGYIPVHGKNRNHMCKTG